MEMLVLNNPSNDETSSIVDMLSELFHKSSTDKHQESYHKK